MNQVLEENDVILCTVKRIEGTTVFLEIQVNSHTIQGTMIFSEVSPGRIRNIREYVVPNKKIVCKVLRIKDNHPQLSLRRVTAKERDEVLEHHKKERILSNSIKPVLKEKTSEVLKKIREKYDLAEFLDDARENPSILKKFFTPSQTKQLEKIFAEKKEREKEVKQIIILKSHSPSGLDDIKKVLSLSKHDLNIYYLGSSKFTITVKAKTYKDANITLETIIEQIKSKAKKLKVNLEVKEK